MKLSIIIPVFNEEKGLNELQKRLIKALDKDFTNWNYEIIFVDDGSSDSSFEVLTKLHTQNNKIKIIKFKRNFGQHVAISAGLKYAKGNYFVIMDDDLQDNPEEIIRLYNKLKQGYNIIYSVRASYDASSFKIFTSKIFWFFLKYLTGLNIPSNQSMLKIFDTQILKKVIDIMDDNPFFPVIFYKAGLKQSTLSVKNAKRFKGKTKYTIAKMIKLMATAYSYNKFYKIKRTNTNIKLKISKTIF